VNLVADIGNTHTKIALFQNGNMVEKLTAGINYITEAAQWIHSREFSRAIICRVGKTSEDIIYTVSRMCDNVISMDHFTPVPVTVSYSAKELGPDRIAAACGALSHFSGRDVLIIDAGTAITIDYLSPEGKFLGGNISPGLALRFLSLNEHTSDLPLVEKDGSFIFFGSDTRTAIISGVQKGIIYELEGYASDFLKQHPGSIITATGGDAEFLMPLTGCDFILKPDLVLEGLDRILNYNFGE
jgi:type III pantothenate kinase